MSAAIWVVVPAAGRGARFGAPLPKQYLQAGGQILLAHTLDALLAHPAVAGAMVVIGQDDDLHRRRDPCRLGAGRVAGAAGHRACR